MIVPLLTALIFVMSGFTMSFAGFGFALVSVPLLALFMPVREAVALQFPYCFLLFVYQAWHYRRHFHWTDMRAMAAGVVLGAILGTTLLHHLPAPVLKKGLGAFTAAVVLLNATSAGKALQTRYAQNRWWGRWCGFISGSFFGAYTIGGPAAALYIFSVQNDPLRAKSFLATFFSFQFLLLVVIYGATGLVNSQTLMSSALFAPVVIAGSAAGFFAFRRASARLYQTVVNIFLLLASIALWVQA